VPLAVDVNEGAVVHSGGLIAPGNPSRPGGRSRWRAVAVAVQRPALQWAEHGNAMPGAR
jgi:hypothetical protein